VWKNFRWQREDKTLVRVRETEARSEEQTGTNWIKPRVITGPVNFILYAGHGSCDNLVFVPTVKCALISTHHSQMKFAS